MKKFFALILAVMITATSVSACSSKPQTEQTTIRIAGLKGPTSMGMVKLMEDNENSRTKNHYEFTLAGSADEVTPKFIKGEYDIAAVPANLASVLYNNTGGKVKLLAVNTLGVIYIVERGDSIKSVQDLAGKTIYGAGKGSTPEYSLRYILKNNGLDPDRDVNIEWKSEHAEVVQMLAQNNDAVGLLPQPFVTVAQSQMNDLSIALDLTKEWDALGNGSQMITGVLAVRSEFAAEHRDELDAFLREYAESVDYVNSYTDEAASLIEKNDIIKATVAQKALPYCNIVCISGQEMQNTVSGYLKVLYDAEPKSVGGQLPDGDFYYE